MSPSSSSIRTVLSNFILTVCFEQWNIMYHSVIPTTILLNKDNVIQGYDFWKTDARTRVITRFFNIMLGKIDSKVFDFPQQKSRDL